MILLLLSCAHECSVNINDQIWVLTEYQVVTSKPDLMGQVQQDGLVPFEFSGTDLYLLVCCNSMQAMKAWT